MLFELEGNGGHYRYRLEVEFDEDQGRQRIRKEGLQYNEGPLFSSELGEAQLYRDDHSEGPAFPMDWSQSGVGFLMSSRDNTRLTWFKERLRRTYLLRLQPAAMAEESRGEASRPTPELSNFADWYRYLMQAQPDRIHELTEAIRERLPGFRALRFKEAGEGKVLLADFEAEAGGTMSLRFAVLSDGQKALIGLYCLLYALPDPGGATLHIDEPENFLALPEIQPWLDQLSDMADERGLQVLLISHHPRLMNFLVADRACGSNALAISGPLKSAGLAPRTPTLLLSWTN